MKHPILDELDKAREWQKKEMEKEAQLPMSNTLKERLRDFYSPEELATLYLNLALENRLKKD